MDARAFIASSRQFIAGHKTYVIGALGLVYSLGVSRNWWPSDPQIWGTLGFTGLVTLRAAVTKMATQFLDDLTKASATPATPAVTDAEQRPGFPISNPKPQNPTS
jgi:hypothetical protein